MQDVAENFRSSSTALSGLVFSSWPSLIRRCPVWKFSRQPGARRHTARCVAARRTGEFQGKGRNRTLIWINRAPPECPPSRSVSTPILNILRILICLKAERGKCGWYSSRRSGKAAPMTSDEVLRDLRDIDWLIAALAAGHDEATDRGGATSRRCSRCGAHKGARRSSASNFGAAAVPPRRAERRE
jgi:hypothetical protein